MGDSPLQAIFLKGLARELKDELAVREECNSRNSLIDLAIRLDNRVRERARVWQGMQERRLSTNTQLYSPDSPTRSPEVTYHAQDQRPPSADEPMQLGRTCLTPAEQQRCMWDQLCLYCAQRGHYVSHCTEAPRGWGSPVVGRTEVSRISSPSTLRVQIQGRIYHHDHSVPNKVLVDSGADESLIDSDFVNSHGLPTYELVTPKEVHSVDNKLLALVTPKTELLRLSLA